MSLQPLESGQVTVNNREREVKKRKSGKAKASYKDKAAPRNNGNTKEEDPRQHMERAYWDILRYTVLRCIKASISLVLIQVFCCFKKVLGKDLFRIFQMRI